MDELLATPPFSSSLRGFPSRRRLEPLPEEEDTDSPTQTPAPVIEKETPSPEQVSHSYRAHLPSTPAMSHMKSHSNTSIVRPLKLTNCFYCNNRGDTSQGKMQNIDSGGVTTKAFASRHMSRRDRHCWPLWLTHDECCPFLQMMPLSSLIFLIRN